MVAFLMIEDFVKVIAEHLSARHWITDSGQRWLQVLYVYMFITLLECN